jgi:hypothetical protein
MNTRELEVLDLALTLYDGENRAGQLCPACKGGVTGECTFSVKRDSHHVYYKCHRASCGYAGRVRTSGEAADERRREKRIFRTFVLDPEPVQGEAAEAVKQKYLLSDDEYHRAGFGWTRAYSPPDHPGRLWIPMRRRDGGLRGYTVRDLTGQLPKKAMNFKLRDEDNTISWYNNRNSKKLILVEDAFSALRASSFMNAVNLSGVHVSEDDLDEFLRNGFTEAYIALDKDATKQAVKLALRYRGRYPLSVIPLPKDLKNMERDELADFLREYV